MVTTWVLIVLILRINQPIIIEGYTSMEACEESRKQIFGNVWSNKVEQLKGYGICIPLEENEKLK
jgi:hypothetical protein